MISRGKIFRGKQWKQPGCNPPWKKKSDHSSGNPAQAVNSHPSFPPSLARSHEIWGFQAKVAHLSSVLNSVNSVLGLQADISEWFWFWRAAYQQQWRHCHDLQFHSMNHRCWMSSGSLCKAYAAPALWYQAGKLKWACVCWHKLPSCLLDVSTYLFPDSPITCLCWLLSE